MKKVYFTGHLRGFFKQIIDNPPDGYKYYKKESLQYYETNSRMKLFAKKIFVSKLGDLLGLIIVKNMGDEDKSYDLTISYNRFLNTNNNYMIVVENPTALYHYSLKRKDYFLGKKKIKNNINKDNLKALICISKACRDTCRELLNINSNSQIAIECIYPLVKLNKYVNETSFLKKNSNDKVKFLFVSSNFLLKGGYEVIEIFKGIDNSKVELTIISRRQGIRKECLDYIDARENISFIEFNLSYEKLEKIYSEHDVLLHLTRQDSFGLVILEAMKAGMAIISSTQYAIPEMVQDGYNGYLVDNKYEFFNKRNVPNESVWNNRSKTIYKEYLDENIIERVKEKVNVIINDRQILTQLRINSWNKAKYGEFSEEYIKGKWKELYDIYL